MPATDTGPRRGGDPRGTESGAALSDGPPSGGAAGPTASASASASGDCTDFASGLDALEAPQARSARHRLADKALGPVLAVVVVLGLWQLAHTLSWSAALPAPAEVGGDLAAAWSDGTLLPSLLHSIQRCLLGFLLAVAIGAPLGLFVARYGPARSVFGPILSAVQSLPAAALVPVAVIALGESEGAVYTVVLLGAVPSVAMGLVAATDQVSPLLLRAGRTLGATGWRGAVHVLIPAAMPGFVIALKQGWTFGWRALMTAELITATPLPGVGRILNEGKESADMSLVLAAVLLILAIGVLVEAAIFAPVERRVLRSRGLQGGPA
ncbi:ABC transporter permease [Streptomyces lycii]|uniref:ABC transporter permease subunit n=1 Tax=Streptomyces lycii TaxID=2654337 RepID=A0ABQ7FLY6_9ACTN|nr:ABC transporter permease subunit [Streptomyces lycii]KAF4408973.1 ABC transporter permease subunit [Streptomyces lycii]